MCALYGTDSGNIRGDLMINTRQILLGTLLLLIGTLVYLIDRPPEQVFFLSILPVQLTLYNMIPPLFGPLNRFLPDLMHVMAFILLTAGVLACGRRGYLLICLFWLAVDGGFELGQKYSARAAGLVPDWFDNIFFLDHVKIYFMNGSYSNHDMIAIVIGVIIAYLILIYSQDKRRA